MTKDDLIAYKDYLKKIKLKERDNLLVKDISFGCEFEFNGISEEFAETICKDLNNTSKNNFEISDDITVDAEIKTSILRNNKETWQEIKKLLFILNNLNTYVDERTASHIHVDTNKIDTRQQLSTLIKTLCIFEPIIYRFGYGIETKAVDRIYEKKGHSTLTRILNPKEVQSFINELDNNYHNHNKLTQSYLDFIYNKVFYRPGFNFREFDIFKIIPKQQFINLINQKKQKTEYYQEYYIPQNNNIEFRNFNGTLNYIIWQNNVDLVTRIIHGIANKKIDFDKISYLFDSYPKEAHEFYKGVNKKYIINNLKNRKEYNKYIDAFEIDNNPLVLEFINQFYNLFENDNISKENFLKQYYKIYNEEDEYILNIKK